MNKTIYKKLAALILTLVLIIVTIPLGTIVTFAAGKTYYVAVDGNSANSGLSAESPITLSKINTITLKAGDCVLFKRGDVFYGNFTPTLPWNFAASADTARIVVDAYGEGDLPTLSLAKIAGNNWANCNNGFWKYDLANASNYKGVSNDFLAETDYANVGFFETKDGTIYGRRFANSESCANLYDFYCDSSHIYVKTDANPFYTLGEVTMAVHGALITTERCMIFKNIHLKYGGYGFSNTGAKNSYITIENCVIECLGGTDIDATGGFTRGGNGIELYNNGNNVIVKNNIFRDIYDVAFTCQGTGAQNVLGQNIPAEWNNIIVTNNIFAFNTQALEIWCGNNNVRENNGVTGLDFTNNLCIGQGEGWTLDFRADSKHLMVDILSYGYEPTVWNMNLTGNTYFHTSNVPALFGLNIDSDIKFLDNENYNVVSDDNALYLLSSDSTVYRTHYNYDYANFAEWQMLGKDLNSTITVIGNQLANYDTLKYIASTSYNFDDIVDAAISAGLTVNTEYDNTATTAAKLESNISVAESLGGNIEFDAMLKGDYCTVTVTATPEAGKQLKADGLKYTLNGNSYPIVKRVDATNSDGSYNVDSESQCTAFEFNLANNATDVVISAEFVENGSANVAVIGTSVNKQSYKLRFRSRAASIYVENGVKYTIESCGTLLFKESQANLETAWEQVAYGKVVGKNVKALSLYDRCDDYYEFVCHINYGSNGNAYLEDNYYAYPYAIYKANNGSKITVFSTDEVAHSYSEVAAVATNLIA